MTKLNISYVNLWELKDYEDVHPSHRTAVVEVNELIERLRELIGMSHVESDTQLSVVCVNHILKLINELCEQVMKKQEKK